MKPLDPQYFKTHDTKGIYHEGAIGHYTKSVCCQAQRQVLIDSELLKCKESQPYTKARLENVSIDAMNQ